jgi:CheY-like chemotaxis protein
MSDAERCPTMRVLVADAEQDHRAWVVRLLRAEGYIVHETATGHDVLQMLFAVPPKYFGVVVCDQMMPGLRGTECLALAGSRAQFVIVTGSRDALVETAAEQFGAAALLRKPFDTRTLADVVHAIVCDGPTTCVRAKLPPVD